MIYYNLVRKKHEYFYVFFRIMVGLLFFEHGAQKLFGLFGAKASVSMFSLMWFVGIIEFFGGLLIAAGLLTRLAAFASSIVMAGGFITPHLPPRWVPLMNKGELALVYFASFIFILAKGGGKVSLEKVWIDKEIF